MNQMDMNEIRKEKYVTTSKSNCFDMVKKYTLIYKFEIWILIIFIILNIWYENKCLMLIKLHLKTIGN